MSVFPRPTISHVRLGGDSVKKKVVICGAIGVSIGLIVAVSLVLLQPSAPSTPTQGENLYFWAETDGSKLVVFITNEGDEVVVLRRVVLPDYGVTTPLMHLANIEPDSTLPYLLIQNDPILCDQIASAEYLTIRIVTEEGIYEN